MNQLIIIIMTFDICYYNYNYLIIVIIEIQI